jgi:uncharacterized protein YbgA (DUF1722 family)/uncharacterized protein YbbK (DUF523 family)
MARSFPKPLLFCSRCITFEFCRWNAGIISSEQVERLKKECDFITNCPEKEIGLGVPRESLRLVGKNKHIRLVQPATSLDYTEQMIAHSEELIKTYSMVDGFILKGKSPSCGYDGVKIYGDVNKMDIKELSAGIFGGIILDNFSSHPIIDEYRLKNDQIWEHFITQIFTLAAFRAIKSEMNIQNLIDFHSRNKLLLMAYNQNLMRVMGKLVANAKKQPIEEVYDDYEVLLRESLSTMPRYTQHINVLYHALGYFRGKINSNENKFFLDEIENFRHGLIPLSVCLHLLQNWIIRFDERYLASQNYFQPYPSTLVNLQPFSSRLEKLERLKK